MGLLGTAELGAQTSELGTIELAAIDNGGSGGSGSGGLGSTAVFVNFTRVNNPRYLNTMYSRYSGIILDAPKFDDSIVSQNKINLYKTMTRVAYTYVQSTNRVSLKYEYVIDRNMSLALRNFVQANIAQQMTLTTWTGSIYYGYFGNNPIEFVSDHRYGHGNDAVTVSIEFLGVKFTG